MPTTRPTESPRPTPTRALAYVRVSSEEQGDGFSLDAQLTLLRRWAAEHGCHIEREYVEKHSAKGGGRPQFRAMIGELARRPVAERVVLCEKIDRWTRNWADRALVDSLELTVVLVRSGRILGPDSDPSDLLVADMESAVARHFISNLRRECRKGMRAKAASGQWPTGAPYGYRNVTRLTGEKVIEPEPTQAPFVRRVFEWYADGTRSLDAVLALAHSAGMRNKRGGTVHRSLLHRILGNVLYTGVIHWDGETYAGQHPPLVPADLFEAVQRRRQGRRAAKRRASRHAFAFAGLLRCGYCGRSVTQERQKRRLNYYHCAAPRRDCARPFVREEVLAEHFAGALDRLRVDPAVAAWIGTELHREAGALEAVRAATLTRLRAQATRRRRQLDQAYADRLDQQIDLATYQRHTARLSAELRELDAQMAAQEQASTDHVDDAVALVDVVGRAADQFRGQSPFEQAELLRFAVSNATWKRDDLQVEFREPFGLLAATTQCVPAGGPAIGPDGTPDPAWYPRRDSNP